MSNVTPSTPSAGMRLSIRRTLIDGAIRQRALAPEPLNSVATIKLENAIFQLSDGLTFSCRSGVKVILTDRNTLQIVVTPSSQTTVKGEPVVMFGTNLIVVSNLGVRLNGPAIALLGEMSHTRLLGELSISLVGGADSGVLSAHDKSRPFAIKLPLQPSSS
jgi:hypothetical protein